MLSVEEALAQILTKVRPLPTERVDLVASLGRVLAETVRSRRVIPPWPNSSMDGYAVRASDTRPGAALTVIDAREAELPYALVGMVTDYDCWREEEAAVDVAQVIAQLSANPVKARAMVVNLLRSLPETREPSPIDTCLDTALITAPHARDPELLAKLDAVAGRALGG